MDASLQNEFICCIPTERQAVGMYQVCASILFQLRCWRSVPSIPAFVALPLTPTVAPGPVASPVTPAPTQASPSQDLIRVEIQRAGATVTMQWPVSAAAQCAQMLVSGHPTTSSHRALERGSYVSM